MRSLYVALLMAFLPSRIRIILYRLTGSKIGKRVTIGFGTVILTNEVEIGDNSTIGHFCLIKVNALSFGKHVSIGHLVRINAYRLRMNSRAIISSLVHIAGDSSDGRSIITLGMHSWIFERCHINVTREVTLGKNVGVGGGTYLFTHGYWLSKLDGFPVDYGPVTIEDNVWIPWNCFIMPNVNIGKNVVVGASSLINKNVPENSLVAGVPAREIKRKSFQDVSEKEKIEIIRANIKDFAERKFKNIDIKETDQKIEFFIDSIPLIILYKESQNNMSDLPKSVLNIFFNDVPRAVMECCPCFSLNGYLSSSTDIMPKAVTEWLQYARYIGLRFYAIDEI
jgi:acetyltransferase-like isoleucine patch superfamily enzyme